MPRTRKTKVPAAIKKKPVHLTDTPKLPMAEGGLVSMNVETRNAAGSALVNISTETGGLSSTYVAKGKSHEKTIKLKSKEPFSLKVMQVTSGVFKGRQVFLLEPDQTPDEGFPFLELPSEIRNMIYKFLLVKQDGEKLWVAGKQAKHIHHNGPKSLCILRTCHQVYQEAAGIYYGLNRFDFTDTTALFHYLERVGSCASFLREVGIGTMIMSTTTKAGKLLAQATNLTKVEINMRSTGRGYVNDWDTGTIRPSYVAILLLPLLSALQETKNDREQVFRTISTVGAEIKCLACKYPTRAAAFGPDRCRCQTCDTWLAQVKGEIFAHLKDRAVLPPAMTIQKVVKEKAEPVERNKPITRSVQNKGRQIADYYKPVPSHDFEEFEQSDEDDEEDEEEDEEGSDEAIDEEENEDVAESGGENRVGRCESVEL